MISIGPNILGQGFIQFEIKKFTKIEQLKNPLTNGITLISHKITYT